MLRAHFLALVLVALAASAPAGTIRVDVSGGGDYLTIGEGVDAASPGDTVLVAPGTYTGALNREIDFAGKSLLLDSVEGAATTTIDCEGLARAFYFHSGEDTTSVVRGFTVEDAFHHLSGGAAACVGSSPKLVACVFSGNTAGVGSGESFGGAVYTENSAGVIDGCCFTGNVAQDGAGMYTRNSHCTVRRCRFVENHATRGGGGLRILYDGGSVTYCTFAGNTAPTYGGALFFCYSSPVFANCSLAHNAASQGGGAYGYDASPTFTDCIIALSTEGSGVFCPGSSSFTISHCCVFGNAGGDSLCGDSHDNMFVDPRFCDAPDGELTLEECSPCIGAGGDGGNIGAWGAGCPCEDPTGVDAWGANGPPDAAILAAMPNPLADATRVEFRVPGPGGPVELGIHNLRGQLVRNLVSACLEAGDHVTFWDGLDTRGRRVASGVYFVRYAAGDRTDSRKVVVVR